MVRTKYIFYFAIKSLRVFFSFSFIDLFKLMLFPLSFFFNILAFKYSKIPGRILQFSRYNDKSF